MKVCLLTQYYPPEVTGVAPFNGELAQYLARHGIDVTVLTAYPHYPTWTPHPPFDRIRPRRYATTAEGIEVIRRRTYIPNHRPGTWARIRYDSSLTLSVWSEWRHLAEADVILCISPPLQLAVPGAIARVLRRVPMVLHLQDLVPDAAVAVGMMSDNWLFRVAQVFESAAYSSANHITVISPGFKRRLVSQGVANSKITVMTNWVSAKPANPDIAAAFRARLGLQPGDTLVVYSGNIGRKQGLNIVVDAARRAPIGVHFAIVGAGTDRTLLASEVERAPNARISLMELQSDYSSTLAAADILLLCQLKGVIGSVAPSKLLTYMAAGRPVIAAVHSESEAAHLVSEASAGVVVPPGDAAALLDAVQTLRSDPVTRAKLAANGSAYVDEHFARDGILAKWLELLQSVARRH